MKLKHIFFVLIIGFSQNLWAQQWVENGALDTINVHLDLQSSAEPRQLEINKNLRAIAYIHQKPTEILQIDLDLVVSYQVYRQEKGNFKSKILVQK